MLTPLENERLCRVGAGTPMGRLMRRSWLPLCGSDELEPDGTARRVRLLGENLIAAREPGGRIALVDADCPRDRLRTSYAARECGGLAWAYLGPAGSEPVLPTYRWMEMPPGHTVVVKVGLRANYAQGMEGSLDSAHSWFLHRGAVRDWKTRSSVSTDTSPRIEAEDTAYGFRYAALRRVDGRPSDQYVRITLFVAPYTIFIPEPLDKRVPAHVQMFVPVDDVTTMFFGVWFSQDGNPIAPEPVIEELGVRPGLDLDPAAFRFRNHANLWGQDRASMKAGSFAGIDGVLQQDFAVQESMGPIVARLPEHLGTSDVAVIRMRRRMLDALDAFEERGEILGRDSIRHVTLRAEQIVGPNDVPWKRLESIGNPA